MALLTEHDVVNMRFKEPKSVSEGYDQDEVDFFLDEVAETIAQLTKDKAALENELKAARARAAGAEAEAVKEAPDSASTTGTFAATTPTESETATGMLILAQELHDKHVAEGKQEGERIVTEAKAESEKIISDANDEYNRVKTKLEQEKSLLDRKIAELRDFERDYRTRLSSYLSSLLGQIESGSNAGEGSQN